MLSDEFLSDPELVCRIAEVETELIQHGYRLPLFRDDNTAGWTEEQLQGMNEACKIAFSQWSVDAVADPDTAACLVGSLTSSLLRTYHNLVGSIG